MLSSRMSILFFTALFLATFSAMLFVSNPAIAITPIGFSVAFIGMLAVAFFIDWALSKVTPWHRLAMVPLTLIGMMVAFASMGAPGWAILAMILTSVGFAVSANHDKRRRALKMADIGRAVAKQPGSMNEASAPPSDPAARAAA